VYIPKELIIAALTSKALISCTILKTQSENWGSTWRIVRIFNKAFKRYIILSKPWME